MAQVNEIEPTMEGLREAGIEYGQLEMVDIHGILRGKFTVADDLIDGSAMINVMLSCASDDEVVPSAFSNIETGMEKYTLTPDLSTLKVLPWRENTASVICDLNSHDGTPCPYGPRHILRNAQQKLAAKGYDAKVGMELEFYLYHADDELLLEGRYRELRPFGRDRHAYSLNRSDSYEPIARELFKRLAAIGIHAETFHTEYGIGMYECTYLSASPLEAADGWVRLKTYLKELCREFNLVTSYMPVLAFKEVDTFTGVHHNISLWRDGKNSFWDSANEKLSVEGEHFAAGVLATMQDFHLLFRPFVNSYRRMDPGAFSPSHVSWGEDNHFSSLRVVHGASPEKMTRLEHRVAGSDANIHLALAAIILGGLHGMENELALPASVDGVLPDDFKVPALTPSLPEATACFRNSETAWKLLGRELVEHYCVLKDAEWEMFENWAQETGHEINHNDRNVTQWEYQHYFDWL